MTTAEAEFAIGRYEPLYLTVVEALRDLESRLRANGRFDHADAVRAYWQHRSESDLQWLAREHNRVLVTTDYGSSFDSSPPKNVSASLSEPIWDQRPGETFEEGMHRHGLEGTCPFCDDPECPW